eukprot:TRINITY_DN4438_c0_g1_i10.p1 TRINITY_DN4438_c0_g1~~TRINITY_DN4438_c0_g1_i10.p1  ORF type:complete len:599 (+),score=55.90 TRINITY_DN4438_c0_g1_i10:30-1826(+)
MAAYSYSDLGFFCASVTLICVHLARSVCAHSCIRTIRASVAHVSKILSSVARPMRVAAETAVNGKVDDPIDDEVSRMMKERQKKHMSICSKILCHATSIALLSIVANIVNGQPRWMTFEQTIVMLVLLLIGLGVNSQSFLEHEFTVYASYFTFMTLSVIWIVVGDYSGQTAIYSGQVVLLYTLIVANLLRLLATVYVMHFSMSVSWGVVCFLATCCKLVFVEFETSFPISNILAIEAVNCISVVLLSEGIRNATCAELLHVAKAAAGSIEKSAATTLLENVCDVSLNLDPALEISEDALRFKAMLMLNPNSSVQGLKLENYMSSEEDKTRMRRHLNGSSSFSSSSQESRVRCFNVSIRDSDGNDMKVEMFSVAFESLSGARRYMLGIREFSDLAPLRRTVDLNRALQEPHRRNENDALPRGETRQTEGPADNPSPRGETRQIEGPADNRVDASEHSESNQSSDDAALPEGGTPEVEGVQNDQADALGLSEVVAARTSASTVAPPALQRQRWRETTDEAKFATTISLIGSWSSKTSRMFCCALHAGVPEVQRVLKRIRKSGCMEFRDGTDQQCSACGVFADDDIVYSCKTCEHAMQIPL